MKSVFSNAAFSRFDLGAHALLSPRTLPQARLGVDFGELKDKIENLIGELPSDQVGEYKKRLEACLAMDAVPAIGCLLSLYSDVQKARDGKPVTPPIPTQQPTSAFPIVPVAIAGVGALALIYMLTKS